MAMDEARRADYLNTLQHITAAAAMLTDLLQRVSDVIDDCGLPDVKQSHDSLSRAVRAVTKNAVI